MLEVIYTQLFALNGTLVDPFTLFVLALFPIILIALIGWLIGQIGKLSTSVEKLLVKMAVVETKLNNLEKEMP